MGGVILGLIVVVVGLMILIDVRGFGSWAMLVGLMTVAASVAGLV
jgi:hypothetical protein